MYTQQSTNKFKSIFLNDEKINFDNNQFCLNLEMMEIKICFQTYKLFKHKVVQS